MYGAGLYLLRFFIKRIIIRTVCLVVVLVILSFVLPPFAYMVAKSERKHQCVKIEFADLTGRQKGTALSEIDRKGLFQRCGIA